MRRASLTIILSCVTPIAPTPSFQQAVDEAVVSHIRMLPPAAFARLPEAVADDLTDRGCQIAQALPAEPHNVVVGRFSDTDRTDIAAWCYEQGRFSIRVYWGGKPRNSGAPDAARERIAATVGGQSSSYRGAPRPRLVMYTQLRTIPAEELRRVAGGPSARNIHGRLTPISHDGIAQVSIYVALDPNLTVPNGGRHEYNVYYWNGEYWDMFGPYLTDPPAG